MTMLSYRFNLADLFDRAGRLRPLAGLPPEVQTEIASFEVVRVTTRRNGETVTTEELIRVKTRDRRTRRSRSVAAGGCLLECSPRSRLRRAW